MKKLKVLLIALLIGNSLMAQTVTEGLIAFENSQYNKAKSIFFSLLNSKPEVSAEAYFHLASVYEKLNKTDSADLIVKRMVSTHPTNAFTKVAEGKLYLYKKNIPAAKISFDDALKMTANKDAKIMYWIADSYLTVENADGPSALAILNNAVKIDPKNAALYILMGDAYKLDQSAGGPAITNYEKAIEMNSLLAKANERIGVVYSQARNYQSSSEAFEKSLAVDANYAPTYQDYAMLNYNFKRYEKARELYEKFLSIADSNELTLTRHVYILFQVKDYQAATQEINRLMQLDSSNNLLNRLLAYSYCEQKKDSIGLIYMKRFLLKVEPSKIIPLDYRYYGRMLSRTGNDSLGIEQLTIAISYDSTDVDMWQDLGEAFNRTKRYCDAANAFTQKLNVSKNPSALDYFYLTKAFYYCKNYTAADSTAQLIINLKPSSHIGWLWRGNSNAKLYPDDMEKAYPYYLRVAEISDSLGIKIPNNDAINAYRFLGVYYIKKDDPAKAKTCYEKILARDPKDQEAIDNLKQLK